MSFWPVCGTDARDCGCSTPNAMDQKKSDHLYLLAAVPAAYAAVAYLSILPRLAFCLLTGAEFLAVGSLYSWYAWSAVCATVIQCPFYIVWAVLSRELSFRQACAWVLAIVFLNAIALPYFLWCKRSGTADAAVRRVLPDGGARLTFRTYLATNLVAAYLPSLPLLRDGVAHFLIGPTAWLPLFLFWHTESGLLGLPAVALSMTTTFLAVSYLTVRFSRSPRQTELCPKIILLVQMVNVALWLAFLSHLASGLAHA